LIGVIRSGFLKDAEDLRRMRWIGRYALRGGDDFLAANVHRVFAAEFRGYFSQRVLHGLAVFRLRKIDKGLVGEFGKVDFGFSSGHGAFPPRRANK